MIPRVLTSKIRTHDAHLFHETGHGMQRTKFLSFLCRVSAVLRKNIFDSGVAAMIKNERSRGAIETLPMVLACGRGRIAIAEKKHVDGGNQGLRAASSTCNQ